MKKIADFQTFPYIPVSYDHTNGNDNHSRNEAHETGQVK